MRAKFFTPDDEKPKYFNFPVVIPQMAEGGGFTLVGFRGWEEVNEEKMCAAVTGIISFEIEEERVGF